MITVYTARHASYLLRPDGSLIAILPPNPEAPATVRRHTFGDLHRVYPDNNMGCGTFAAQLRYLAAPWIGVGDLFRWRHRGGFDRIVVL